VRGPINKISDPKIESTLKAARNAAAGGKGKPLLLGDGGGLWLQVSRTAAASWLFRYMRAGKTAGLGLGGYPETGLKLARSKAEACRTLLAEGKNPLEEKRATKAAEKLTASKGKTFDICAAEYIADHRDEWKNAKHVQQWENTLATYVSPAIGTLPIGDVATEDMKRILNPIWGAKHETATRVRGRIEAIIDWATAHGLRTGDNPARWKGHLEHLLAKTTVQHRAKAHHPALPHADLPAFILALAPQEGMARWALEFLILTAARTSEITGAQWTEIDEKRFLWTVPKERMKAGREHRIPLTPRALAILRHIRPASGIIFIFPGQTADKPMSNMTMTALLRRMERGDITVHGFRSTFRDWVGEKTSHDFRTAEAALAHRLPDKVEAAYARSDLYEKRFAMMKDWEEYCTSRTVQNDLPGKVI
jgi:integrase